MRSGHDNACPAAPLHLHGRQAVDAQGLYVGPELIIVNSQHGNITLEVRRKEQYYCNAPPMCAHACWAAATGATGATSAQCACMPPPPADVCMHHVVHPTGVANPVARNA